MGCRASCVRFLGLDLRGSGYLLPPDLHSRETGAGSREPGAEVSAHFASGEREAQRGGARPKGPPRIPRPRLALRSLQDVPGGARGPWLCRPSRGSPPRRPRPHSPPRGLGGRRRPGAQRFLNPGSPPRARPQLPRPSSRGSGSTARAAPGLHPAHAARPGGEAPSLARAWDPRPCGKGGEGAEAGPQFPHLENGRHHPRYRARRFVGGGGGGGWNPETTDF